MNSTWSGLILIPGANTRGYELIFAAETWLRRISLTALMTTHGAAWELAIDDKLRSQLSKQSKWNSARWYLGVEAGEELLWSTTHSQLSTILRIESIQGALNELAGMSGEVLAARLDGISKIRNSLAHNRAISPNAIKVLEGDLVVVNAAVSRFIDATLYAPVEIHMDPEAGKWASLVNALELESQKHPSQQFFVGTTPHFIQLTRLPVEPFDRWPNISKFKAELDPVTPWLVSCFVNIGGDEFSIVVPKSTDLETLVLISERFSRIARLPSCWTTTPPESQDPAYSSWPRAWFYANSPEDD